MGNYPFTIQCDFEKNNKKVQLNFPLKAQIFWLLSPSPPYRQVVVMWPKLNLPNTPPKTLNLEPVRWDYENNWGVNYCSSSLWGVKKQCCDGSYRSRRMMFEVRNAAHSIPKPPVSSLHPVNKSPSAPIKSTSFSFMTWAALTLRPSS